MESTSTTGKLTAQRRTTKGKEQAAKLRQKGLIPAVCYGGGGESIPLAVDPVALKKALDPAKRRNTFIELMVEDGKSSERLSVMVKNYQVDPLKLTLLHADFIRVAEDEVIDAAVPLLLTGKPEGVKVGGNLHQVFRTIPVRCIPQRIPVSMTLDVTALNIGDSLRVKDLAAMSEGVTIALPPNQTLALVMAPRKVAEVAAEAVAVEGAEGAPAAEGAEGAAAAPAADKKDEKKKEEKKK
jgi:large subunit ribosomal protein L25